MDDLEERAIRLRWPLDYWDSKEWLDVQDRLDTMEEMREVYSPARVDLRRALRITRLEDTRVVMVGQDPYLRNATGVAFSADRGVNSEGFAIPLPYRERSSLPPSLKTLYHEYTRDLSLPWPGHGCLEPWCEQGVLLWNATPTVGVTWKDGKMEAISHRSWPEWPPLTQEIIERLSARGGIVFVFFGKRAQEYLQCVDLTPGYNSVFLCTHPSPLAQRWTSRPIVGSRLFTEINRKLLDHHKDPIDWRLS